MLKRLLIFETVQKRSSFLFIDSTRPPVKAKHLNLNGTLSRPHWAYGIWVGCSRLFTSKRNALLRFYIERQLHLSLHRLPPLFSWLCKNLLNARSVLRLLANDNLKKRLTKDSVRYAFRYLSVITNAFRPNAPGSFQLAMDVVLAQNKWKTCLAYSDYIIIYSSLIENHIHHFDNMLSNLKDASINLKNVKCLRRKSNTSNILSSLRNSR